MKLPRPTDEVAARYRRAGWWRDRLVDSFIEDAVEANPDATAVAEGDRRLSYAQLAAYVNRFASRLHSMGVGKGDVVSLQLPNWIEALVAHYGIIRAGAISNPIIPIYRERELRHILTEAGSRIAIIPATFREHDYSAMYEQLRQDVATLEHLCVVDHDDPASLDQLAGKADDRHELPKRSADDPALLLYTSGTTATPKGVVHSHNTLDYENRTIIDLFGLGPDDVVFMPSPVTHITGVLYGVQLPVMLSTHVVYQDVWEPGTALELIERERCTFSVAATPFLHGLITHPGLARRDVSSLRVFACGGADVAPELIRAADERLGCVAMRVYGSTEYPTLTASGPDDPQEKRATTDGRLIADAEARIVNDVGVDVSLGEVGELLARGPEMFLGYYGGDDQPFDKDGWFATGDLASMDEDGYIQMRGRKKDIILRGGENISAREVEDLLFEHPDIREVAIVAVPDPVMTEKACAVVVPEKGAEVTLEDLAGYLSKHQIAKQKYPEYLQVFADLPKTASGKVQKYKLRAQLQDLPASIREE